MIDLIKEAKEAGVATACDFAEWLVHIKEYFGNPALMSELDADLAYEQAVYMWERI